MWYNVWPRMHNYPAFNTPLSAWNEPSIPGLPDFQGKSLYVLPLTIQPAWPLCSLQWHHDAPLTLLGHPKKPLNLHPFLCNECSALVAYENYLRCLKKNTDGEPTPAQLSQTLSEGGSRHGGFIKPPQMSPVYSWSWEKSTPGKEEQPFLHELTKRRKDTSLKGRRGNPSS